MPPQNKHKIEKKQIWIVSKDNVVSKVCNSKEEAIKYVDELMAKEAEKCE